MTVFLVIPYILGIIKTPGLSIDQGIPEYTFQVDAKWWFSDFDKLNEHIKLSVDLKCHPVGFDMSCHMEKWRVRQQAHKGRDLVLPGAYYIERTSDQEALQRDSRPFLMAFNQRGVVGYYLEGKVVPRRMMNLYRIIGNQLNIGVDMEKEGDTFEDVEQSNMGSCVVTCTKIKQKPTFAGAVDKLVSYVGCDLENNTITIIKRKIPSRCTVLARRSVSVSFWPNFFPKRTATHVLRKSENYITMSLRSLDSVTDNEYTLIDQDNIIVGDMLEKVELYLKSYHVMPPDSFNRLNEDKLVFYRAESDETA